MSSAATMRISALTVLLALPASAWAMQLPTAKKVYLDPQALPPRCCHPHKRLFCS